MGNIKSGEDPEARIDDDIDDEAWKKLFLRLTGGNEEGALLTNEKTTNLSPKESLPRTNSKHESLGLLAPPSGSLSRLSLSRLSVTRLAGTPLPDLKDRTIDLDTLEKYIMGVKESYTLEIEYGIPRSQLCKAVKKMKLADKDNNGQIDYDEWVSYYRKNLKDARTMFPAFQVMLYQPQYSCRPPPIVILFLSLIQVACYVYHSQLVSNLVSESALAGQAPICSYLIYNPSRRYEVWRFFTYQFVHVNMEHIVFNTLMQLVVGLPLEMSQPGLDGTMKVVIVYGAGVFLGSVGGSLPNPTYYLAGASAGVYSLIAAHLATLLMNWKEDGAVFKGRTESHKEVSRSLDPTIRTARITFVVTFTLFDIIYALYNHYSGTKTNTGYAGHLFGAVAGLLLGIVLLENRKVERWETRLRAASISVYLGLLLITLLWHLVGTDTGYFPSASFAPTCHYVLNTSGPTNMTNDHSHF